MLFCHHNSSFLFIYLRGRDFAERCERGGVANISFISANWETNVMLL